MTIKEYVFYVGGGILAILLPVWAIKMNDRISARIEAFLNFPAKQEKALELQAKNQADIIRAYASMLENIDAKLFAHSVDDTNLFTALENKVINMVTSHQRLLERIDSRMSNETINAKFENVDNQIDNLKLNFNHLEKNLAGEIARNTARILEAINDKSQRSS